MLHEETSHLFDQDLTDEEAKNRSLLLDNRGLPMYEYFCHFCGVKVTTNYTLTMAMRCVDHKVLLQSRKVSV